MRNTPWWQVIVIVGIFLCLIVVCLFVAFLAVTSPGSLIHVTFGDPTAIPFPTSQIVPTWTPVSVESSKTEINATLAALVTSTPLPPLPTYTPLPPLPTYTPLPALPTYTPWPIATVMTEALFTPNQPVFCREGPSEQVWWDEKEALNTGQTVKIVGKSTYEWGLWWYIQKASGTRCWVFGELGSTSGNVAGVPEIITPIPTPTILKVTLRNNHGAPLCQVWIEPAGSGNWTELLKGKTLGVGKMLPFQAAPGLYDIEIIQCPDIRVDYDYGFKIDAGHTKFTTP